MSRFDDPYYAKYLKYRSKYTRLRAQYMAQTGAGLGDEVIILGVAGPDLRPTKPAISTEVPVGDPGKEIGEVAVGQVVKKYVGKIKPTAGSPTPLEYTRYVVYSGEPRDENVVRVVVKEEQRVILDQRTRPTMKKTYFLYDGDVVVTVTIEEGTKGAERVERDPTLTTGTGTVEVTNLRDPDLHLRGRIQLEKGPGIRRPKAEISEVTISGKAPEAITRVDRVPITDARDLFRLLQRSDEMSVENYFERCPALFTASEVSRLVPATGNYILNKNLVDTVCARLFYYLQQPVLAQLIRYPALLKFLIRNDVAGISEHVGDIYRNQGLVTRHTQSIPKRIPSTLANKYLMIRSGKKRGGQYVKVEDLAIDKDFSVIFDSGNSSVTMVGREIVRALGLEPLNLGCRLATHGIGGCATINCEYVVLDLKFSPDFPYANGKEYRVIGFVNDCENLRSTLLFGHQNGLDLLFADQYSIYGEYDPTDERVREATSIKKSVVDAMDRLDAILTQILAVSAGDPGLESKYNGFVYGIRAMNYLLIHSFYEDQMAKTKALFDKLAQTIQHVNTTRPKHALARLLTKVQDAEKD